jgi:tyrosyl-DNA phosphodiesterase 2
LLKLVTFNLWFDEYRWEERLAAALGAIADCRADVVGLQEVTPRQLERILSTDWLRDRYQVSDASGETVQPHGAVLLSRLPMHALALCPLPSQKDRKLLVAEIGTRCGALYVGTLHLESSPENTASRLEQLDRVLPGLHGADQAVLMGDFNFDPMDLSEQSRIEGRYADLWPTLRGEEPGYTADSERNAMRFAHKQVHKRVRFDRILLRSAGAVWRPVSVDLIGTAPISAAHPEVYPSDHFGVCGVLACTPSEPPC